MPYSDALVQHLNALDFLDSPMAAVLAESARLVSMKFYGASPSAFDILRVERDTVREADTFYLESPIQNLLWDSMGTFPRDIKIGDVGFPYPRGFLVFAEPIKLGIVDRQVGRWLGFGWSATDTISAAPTYHGYHGPVGPVLYVSYYHENLSQGPCLLLASTQLWPYWDGLEAWDNTSLEPLDGRDFHVAPAAMTGQHEFVMICLAWLTQRLVRIRSEEPSRAIRRDVQRRGWHITDPVVKRIILRTVESVSTTPSSKGGVDWTCQWIVRPHWRNQYYARERVNKPIWVPSYIKGPHDKPLKTSRAVVFDIAR